MVIDNNYTLIYAVCVDIITSLIVYCISTDADNTAINIFLFRA